MFRERWHWDGPVWDYDEEQYAPWLVTFNNRVTKILYGDIKCRSKEDALLIENAPELQETLEYVLSYLSMSMGSDVDAIPYYNRARDTLDKLKERNK